jgi:hypothetical protein
MSLKTDMHTALMAVAPTAPAKRSQFWSGATPTLWITYFEYNRQPEAGADDQTALKGHYFQVDLWQKSTGTADLDTLETQIESALSPLGFGDFTVQDLYEPDTGISHYAIRCYFLEEV